MRNHRMALVGLVLVIGLVGCAGNDPTEVASAIASEAAIHLPCGLLTATTLGKLPDSMLCDDVIDALQGEPSASSLLLPSGDD